MLSQFKTKAFKELKKQWDLELKNSGFKDLDEHPYRFGNLINRTSDTEYFESRRDYYLTLSHKFNETTFRKKFHEIIMGAYVDGAKSKEIAQALSDNGYQYSRMTISRVIRKYLKFWLTNGN